MAAIYDSRTGSLITAGLLGCKFCDEALISARRIAAERDDAVVLEDDDGDWIVYSDGHCEKV